jgi:hypothetical protein
MIKQYGVPRINQATLSYSSRRNRGLGVAAAVVTLLIIILVGILFLGGNSPTQLPPVKPTPNPIPFDYNLDVSPSNGTLMQGNSVNINVALAYVQGSPENITLSALGVPSGADYTFSQPQGTPTNSSTFNSILTIHVSEATQTNTYNVTINSTADNGKTYTSLYTLSILNPQVSVSVSGTVSGGAGIVPTQIIFDQLTHAGAVVKTFSAPVESGGYIISLPNHQFFAVSVMWEGSDGTSGTHHFIMPWDTDAGVGVTQINCPFSWGP